MTVTAFLYVAAFIAVVASTVSRCPLWIGVLLLAIAGLLTVFPL